MRGGEGPGAGAARPPGSPRRRLRRPVAAAVAAALVGGLLGAPPALPQEDGYGVPDPEAQAAIKGAIVEAKLAEVLPAAMRAHGLDMWIVLERENNYENLADELGGEIGAAFPGVRGAYVLFDRGEGAGVERLFLGSHAQPATSLIPELYDATEYYGYSPEGLTPLLREVVRARDPARIGVNISRTLPEADGLTVGLYRFLEESLDPEHFARLESAELLVRDLRLNKVSGELAVYRQLLEWTDRWMRECFAAVVPGETSAADMYWWMERRAREVGLDVGRSGSNVARVVREGEQLPLGGDQPLQPGDIVGIDSGLQYLGYEIDMKRTAYLLRPGETRPPESIRQAWDRAVAFADVYNREARPGRVGHEVWARIAERAREDGYRVVGPDAGGRAATTTSPEVGVYGHSVGNDSHDIGARVAPDVPFAYGERVRFPLVEGEWHSVEFHVATPIPEWQGRTWYARFEENARVGPEGVEWIVPPQERLVLIPSNGPE